MAGGLPAPAGTAAAWATWSLATTKPDMPPLSPRRGAGGFRHGEGWRRRGSAGDDPQNRACRSHAEAPGRAVERIASTCSGEKKIHCMWMLHCVLGSDKRRRYLDGDDKLEAILQPPRYLGAAVCILYHDENRGAPGTLSGARQSQPARLGHHFGHQWAAVPSSLCRSERFPNTRIEIVQ